MAPSSYVNINDDNKRNNRTVLVAGGAAFIVLAVLSVISLISSIHNANNVEYLTRQNNELRTSLQQLQLQQTVPTATISLGDVQNQVDILQATVDKAVHKVCPLRCSNGGTPNSKCDTCVNCNAGWSGKLCNIPATCYNRCQNRDPTAVCDCLNGGTVSGSTCTCTCKLGWVGGRCEVLDAGVTNAQRKSLLKQWFDKSKAKRDQVDNNNLGATVEPLKHHVGYGVVGFQGTLGAPILAFDVNPSSSNTFSPNTQYTYIVPDEIAFGEMFEGLYWPQLSTNVYPTFASYLSQFNGWSTQAMGNIGPHAVAGVSLDTLRTTYFGSDHYFAETQALYPIYTTKLLQNTANYTFVYKLDPYFEAAIDYIPKSYSASGAAELYDTLLSFWGDSVMIETLEGGVIQAASLIKNVAMDSDGYSVDTAKIDNELYFMANIPNMGSFDKVSTTYSANHMASYWFCAGGDAATRGLCKNSIPAWVTTLHREPVPIKYHAAPLSTFITDPVQKRSMQLAEMNFVAEHKDDLSGGCPVCAHGTCTAPAKYCNCPLGFVGRTCSSCAEGFSGPNCDQPASITRYQCTTGQNLDIGRHRFCAMENELWCSRASLNADGTQCYNHAGQMLDSCENPLTGGCAYYGTYIGTNGHYYCAVPSTAYGFNIICFE